MSIAGKLIKMIKKQPILYDPTHDDYRINEKKDILWDHIAGELNLDVMEVKKRWRNLRDTYVKLLKLVKCSEKDSVFEKASVRKYHRWIWTKEMEFFQPHFAYGSQNIQIPDPIPIKKELRLKQRSVRNVKMEQNISKRSSSIKTNTKTHQIKTERLPAVALKSTPTIPAQSKVTKVIPSTDLDATDRLFLAHSQNIKQFSARRQALTKLKIAEVIMEQEILHQEDVELAAISADTAKKIYSRSRHDDDSPPAFETVCGYASDEIDDVYAAMNEESDGINPVDIDEMRIYVERD